VKLVIPPTDGPLTHVGTQEEKRFAWNPEVLAPADTGGTTPAELLHEMTELAPRIITRIARGTGVEPTRLAPLLDAMSALGLVERDGDRYRNTARGGVPMEETAIGELSLDDPANREALALVLAERTSDKAATDDHALTSLAITGSVLRTRGRTGDLLRAAGASRVEATTLGWGFGPFGTVTVAHA
jgi:hypothetical protein